MKRIAAFAVAALLAPFAGAELYKYVDKDGRTVYSDQPPTGIASKQINPAVGSGPSTKSAVDRDKDLEKGRKEAKEKQEKGEKSVAARTELEQRCVAARQNLQSYTEAGRIYKYNDKGEREFMGDEEISTAREKAQRDVDEACKKT